MTLRAGVAAAVCLALSGAAGPASAQTAWWETFRGRIALHADVAGWTGAGELTQAASPRIYGETAALEAVHDRPGGVGLDVGGRGRVWRRLAAGVAYTQSSKAAAVRLAGAIPHPLRFNAARAVEARVSDASRRERALHLFAAWRVPIPQVEGLDAAVFGGPSFFNLTRETAAAVGLEETGPPFTSVAADLSVAEHVRNGWGGHVGVDVAYLLTPTVGVGGTVRFSRAAIEVPSLGGTASADVGGLQFGGGLRLRF